MLLAALIVAALYFAKVVFVPLALAMLFSFVLTPPVRLLERARLNRELAVLLVMLVVLSGMGTMGWLIVRQFSDVINQLPLYQANMEKKIDALHLSKSSTLQNASATVTELKKALVSPPEAPADEGATAKRSERPAPTQSNPIPVTMVTAPALPLDSVQSGLELLLQVLIVIVFTSFMLSQRENLRNRFIALVGQRQLSAMTQALDEASERVSRYLLTQLTINSIYGAVIGIGLHFLGIPGALLWGAIVGVLRFLPYVGPPLGGIMPVLLSFAIFPDWRVPLITLGMFVCAELIVAHAIEPLMYGAHTGISSLAILVAAIFWTVLWGPVGLVLSTPLTVCIVVLGRYVPHLSFIPVLLGGNPELDKEALVYQRLLATDQEEAEQILESLLEKEPLTKVYDSVLIPALSLAEQDRHRGQIDEHTAGLVFQSAREIADDLFERYGESRTADLAAIPTQLEQPASLQTAPRAKIICVPARDEADEVVAMVLSQLLRHAGYDAIHIPLSTPGEATERVKLHHADIVCISALPPFVISHSRSLCRALKSYSSKLPIVIGMWAFAGDTTQLAQRMKACGGAPVVTNLADAVHEIAQLQGLSLTAEEKTSCV